MTRITNDGRAYLQQTDTKYDLIIFALPDSLTLVSGQSAVRLESFLFTKEAMEAARDHLNPGGAFSMYNYYREPWLLDRLRGRLAGVYGHAPCLDSGRRGVAGRHLSMLDGRPGCKRDTVCDDDVVTERRGHRARDRRPALRLPQDADRSRRATCGPSA